MRTRDNETRFDAAAYDRAFEAGHAAGLLDATERQGEQDGAAWDAGRAAERDRIAARLEYAHLSDTDRTAVLAIIRGES
jgi:hypothetical protein